MQIERARKQHYRMAAVRAVEGAAQEFGSLLKPDGDVNTETVHRVFNLFDTDSNGHIDQSMPRPGSEVSGPTCLCSVHRNLGMSGLSLVLAWEALITATLGNGA